MIPGPLLPLVAFEVVLKLRRELKDWRTPNTPGDAPFEVRLPARLQADFQRLWKDSFPDKAHERGGTLVVDRATGELALVNEKGLGSSERRFIPDLRVDQSKYRAVGTFHTHPEFDQFGPNGLGDASFGGGDLQWFFENLRGTHIVQGAETQYMVAFTRETPPQVDTDELKRRAQQRLNELTSGRRILTPADAVHQVMKEMAAELKLAYYEGKDGTLTRVIPPVPNP